MNKLRFNTILVLIVASQVAAAQDSAIDRAIAERIEEIRVYKPIYGTWEGRFFIKSAPESLMSSLETTGVISDGAQIRLVLAENQIPEVHLKYGDDDDWSLTQGHVKLDPKTVGWHISIELEGGQWLESYSITFDRIEEWKAAFTITRTVHNWSFSLAPQTDDVLHYYHVFGAGEVERVSSN